MIKGSAGLVLSAEWQADRPKPLPDCRLRLQMKNRFTTKYAQIVRLYECTSEDYHISLIALILQSFLSFLITQIKFFKPYLALNGLFCAHVPLRNYSRKSRVNIRPTETEPFKHYWDIYYKIAIVSRHPFACPPVYTTIDIQSLVI